jgi:hypothetical protein
MPGYAQSAHPFSERKTCGEAKPNDHEHVSMNEYGDAIKAI